MSTELFVRRGDAESGPFSSSEIKRMVKAGEILADDQIRKTTDQRFVRVGDIKQLWDLAPPEPLPIQNEVSQEQAAPTAPNKIATALSTTLKVVSTAALSAGGKVVNAASNAISTAREKPIDVTDRDIAWMRRVEAVAEPEEPLTQCPFCAEPIRKAAKKCKHCGEILDVVLREASRPSRATTPVVHVTNVNNNNQVGGGYAYPRWNRGVAFILSLLLPGLGQIYKGQALNGLAWFIVTVIGYAAFIVPGLVLHFCCAIGAASGDVYR